MDNPFQQQTAINWILGVAMTVIGALGALFGRRVDVLEEAHRDSLKHFVTREELTSEMQAQTAAKAAMHVENTRRLERIEDNLTKQFEHVDDGFDKLNVRIDTIVRRYGGADR